MAINSSLTVQQETFACEVAKGKSKSDAYRKAYPRSNRWQDRSVWNKASELAKNEAVASRIAELREKSSMRNEVTVERVLQERARLAFHDVRKFFNEDGTLKAIHELDDDTAAALAGMEIDSIGVKGKPIIRTAKIKLADKDKSLTALEKHLGMYSDDDGKSSPLNIVINLG